MTSNEERWSYGPLEMAIGLLLVLPARGSTGDFCVQRRTADSSVYRKEPIMQGIETPKSMAPASTATDLVGLIRSEYEEMPGLCLTRAQVQRLWLLEPVACETVLRALVDAGYLRLTPGGYVRG